MQGSAPRTVVGGGVILLLHFIRAPGLHIYLSMHRSSPCSRSRWSYHGSSSSVTNSSILPARSIGPGSNFLPPLRRKAPPEVTGSASGGSLGDAVTLSGNLLTRAPASLSHWRARAELLGSGCQASESFTIIVVI